VTGARKVALDILRQQGAKRGNCNQSPQWFSALLKLSETRNFNSKRNDCEP